MRISEPTRHVLFCLAAVAASAAASLTFVLV